MINNDSYWWYVTISAGENEDELLFSVADMTDSIGTELRETPEGISQLRMYYRSNEDLSYWKKKVLDLSSEWKNLKITDFGKMENQPWNVAAEEAFPPLPVGKGLVVLAPWHKGTEPEGLLPLYINPGSAFGTGYHESTQIVLEILEQYIKPGMVTADIGTGSGILTICALKMGAKQSYARDIDPTVIEEVRKNFELNALDLNKIDLATGDLLKDFGHKVDILTANILIEPNSEMVADVPSVIGKDGIGIFSGMLEKERPIFMSAMEAANMEPIKEVVRGEWWGVAAKVKA
ncbi:MAG: 50S ribosomal protein L11 methyltransferase [Synergistaceae bacterium]